MKSPTMLYRAPGAQVFEGVHCDTTIVDEDEVQAHLDAGWHTDWVKADEALNASLAAKLAAGQAEEAKLAQELAEAERLQAHVEMERASQAERGDAEVGDGEQVAPTDAAAPATRRKRG